MLRVTWDELAERSGLAVRRLYSIANVQERVTVDVADAIITKGLGQPGLWHAVH